MLGTRIKALVEVSWGSHECGDVKGYIKSGCYLAHLKGNYCDYYQFLSLLSDLFRALVLYLTSSRSWKDVIAWPQRQGEETINFRIICRSLSSLFKSLCNSCSAPVSWRGGGGRELFLLAVILLFITLQQEFLLLCLNLMKTPTLTDRDAVAHTRRFYRKHLISVTHSLCS